MVTYTVTESSSNTGAKNHKKLPLQNGSGSSKRTMSLCHGSIAKLRSQTKTSSAN